MVELFGWTKKKRWWLRHNDLPLKMAVLSSQTIHAYFAVEVQTLASTHFITGKFGFSFKSKIKSTLFNESNTLKVI